MVDNPPQLVSELIDATMASWNEELVRQVFTPLDAESVLKIPLCTRQIDDFWAWAWERSGVFSVRSAYRVLKQIQDEGHSSAGSSSGEEESWKRLWKLNVQPKFRIFWWRVMIGFLPAKAELARRHIGEDVSCALCGHEDETLFHSLVTCTHAQVFWAEALRFFGCTLPTLLPMTWTRDLLDPSFIAKEDAAVVISVMWAIWSDRNKYTLGERQYQPIRSMELIQEHLRALNIPANDKIIQRQKERWKAPAEGVAKLNVDAATDATGGRAGTAVVAKNNNG